LIILIILGEVYKSRSSSLCSFFHPPVTSSLLGKIVLLGTPEGKMVKGRPRRRRKNNVEICLRETWWGGMDWVHLAQGREQWLALVCRVIHLQF
jgi:hypothetical protein